MAIDITRNGARARVIQVFGWSERRVSLGGGNQANINGIHEAVITSALLYGPNGWATRTRSYREVLWSRIRSCKVWRTREEGGVSRLYGTKEDLHRGTIKLFKWSQPRSRRHHIVKFFTDRSPPFPTPVWSSERHFPETPFAARCWTLE